MIDLTDRTQLGAYLKDQRLWLKKEASQHFLVDREIVDAITRVANLKPTDTVLEIGPGVGTLTQALAEEVTDGLVLAVEYDQRLVNLLRENFKPFHQVKIVHSDFMRFDLSSIETDKAGYKVVSNLPYHLTGAILRQLTNPALEEHQPAQMVLMIQKEVADRLLAVPGTRSRGMPTILTEVYGRVERVVDVPHSCFFPPPEVDSTVVNCVRRKRPLSIPEAQAIIRLAKAGFSAKRRTLANALAGSLRQTKDRVEGWLKIAAIPILARAEDLDFASWQKLVAIVGAEITTS
ncbi:MAG: 16S rRNA (adenine(1518)-N(6)/adenine(1519)-N(6))-dimethyltransferase RsmA [Patescibacteria group bacterium]